MTRTRSALFALCLAACGPSQSEEPSAPQAASAPAPAPPLAPVTMIEDDLEQARELAAARGGLLFVDVWAPWCHTCLSMKHEVLDRPELGQFADRVVFAALDGDKPGAAEFLAEHRVSVWPSFFLIDPRTGLVVSHRGGSMSLGEMVKWIDHALGPETPQVAKLRRAHAVFARSANAKDRAGELAGASASYLEAAEGLVDPQRSEALLGAVRALYEAGKYEDCSKLAAERARELAGSSAPTDFIYYGRTCAKKLGQPAGAATLAVLASELERRAAAPAGEASVDDRGDLLASLADAQRDAGDADAARKTELERLALLEQAASKAKTPTEAQVHDYARLTTLVSLGRADEAVSLLEARVRELPESYEAHARLASALMSAKRDREALAPLERAISLAYGPRKARYLRQKSELCERLGNRDLARLAAEQEVAELTALKGGQRDAARLAEAEARKRSLSKPAGAPP